MIASLKWGAVILGSATGALIASVAAFVLWLPLAWAGVENAPLIGLTFAVLIGLFGSGFVSGRMAPAFSRFHGAVSGLGLATLILLIAKLGGSPAPTSRVLLLAVMAVILGGAGGFVAGRRRLRRPTC